MLNSHNFSSKNNVSGKKSIAILLLLLSSLFASCIGEDFINDEVDEVLVINNPVMSIQVGETYQFDATYFNNVGTPEEVAIIWDTSDNSIMNINPDGLAIGITIGTAEVLASFPGDNGTLSSELSIDITQDSQDPTPIVRTGNLQTTSGYILEGNFVFEEILESNSVQLSLDATYRASSNLPGLYLYLTNNPNSINGAYNAGPVPVFEGAHSFNFDDIQINDFQYLLYWCEPFSVKVGEGVIE